MHTSHKAQVEVFTFYIKEEMKRCGRLGEKWNKRPSSLSRVLQEDRESKRGKHNRKTQKVVTKVVMDS